MLNENRIRLDWQTPSPAVIASGDYTVAVQPQANGLRPRLSLVARGAYLGRALIPTASRYLAIEPDADL